MTGKMYHSSLPFSEGRMARLALAAWLALAVPSLSASARAEEQPASMGAALPDATREEKRQAAEMGKAADQREVTADDRSSATIMPDADFYGPPAPKVQKGQLAAIAWTEPPALMPPALEEAVNLVTRNYPSARSARAALQAAASDVRAAQWLRFPSVTGNLAYLDDLNSPEPQIVVEAPLWSGGRIGSNIRRAKCAFRKNGTFVSLNRGQRFR